MCGFVAFFASQLAGCRRDASEAERLAWGDTFIDTLVRMNEYQLRLETVRDAIGAGGASTEFCDPARSAKEYQLVTKLLENLAADASKAGLKEDVVEKLHHMQSELQTLRTEEERSWAKSANIEGLDPGERCLRALDVAATRVEVIGT